MDYEKKYKEALELARDYYKANLKLNKADENLILEDLSPELKESGDEKIRKTLIEYFDAYPKDYFGGLKKSYILTWLEKQKEPELSKDLGKYVTELNKQIPEVSFAKLSRIAVRVKNWLEKQGKTSDQIHYWTEEEIEPIISDYLRGVEHYGGMIARLRCLKPKSLEKQCEQKSIDYNEELKKCRENPLYFFDKYVKIEERKPVWNEEDEKVRKELIMFIKKRDRSGCDYDYDKWLTWLEKQGNQSNQREQLINKACDVLVNCIEDYMLRRMEVWNEESKKQTLENIRKKLEE